MMKLGLVIVFIGLIGSISAFSNGRLDKPFCTVDAPYGCPPELWVNGDRLNCSAPGREMWWASLPQPTEFITISAEIEGIPVTQYVSGSQFLDIRIRVTRMDQQWRGIMIYAMNEQFQKVGTWKLAAVSPTAYFVDPNMCGNNTLFHARAIEKATTEVLRFVTPPAGTGPITFFALIKSGVANTGAFHLPTPLRLAEFGPLPEQNRTIRWVRGGFNRTCSSVCNGVRINGTRLNCDARYFDLIDSVADLGLNLRPHGHLCNPPSVLHCIDIGPAQATQDQCFYSSNEECQSFGKPFTAPTCASLSPSFQRFCPCNTPEGLTQPVETPSLFIPPPAPAVPEPALGASNSLKPSQFLFMLVGFLALFQSRKQMFLFALLVVIVFASSAEAHNWLNTPSRSFMQAEQILPCPPREQPFPHVQVRAGNDFQVEWVTGHDRFTYWVLVKAEDEPLLSTLNEAKLNEYLTTSPATPGLNNAGGVIADPKYNRYHRVPSNSTSNLGVAGFYQRIIPTTDPLFVPRPTKDVSGFLSGAPGGLFGPTTNFFQAEYKNADRNQDRRAEYFNPKFPFIISAARFLHVAEQPRQPDFTLLRVPPTAAPGSYVAWWKWVSYYDCVDVDVIGAGAQIAHNLTYGVIPANPTQAFLKTDHAIIRPAVIRSLGNFKTSSFGCFPIRPGTETADLNACKAACLPTDIAGFSKTACVGVIVAPLSLPAVSPFTANDIQIPWDFVSPLDTNNVNQCPRASFASLPTGSRVCYPVVPLPVNQFPDAEGLVTSTTDPEKPHFYSSFYSRSSRRVFTANFQDLVNPLPDWRFGSRCGECDERPFGVDNNGVSPFWEIAPICRNCDDPFWA